MSGPQPWPFHIRSGFPSQVCGSLLPPAQPPGHRPQCPAPCPQLVPASTPSPHCRLRSRLGGGSGQADRSTAGKTGGKRSPAPARAPPPRAQPRTSPPCEPSPGSAFLPGKEKRSWLRHRLLKGQHRPSLIFSNPAPPSPPNTCREPPKAWISPPRPLLLPRSFAARTGGIGRAGPGVEFVRPLCCGCSSCWNGSCRRSHFCPPGRRAPALAHLGTDSRAPVAGMLYSPPPRCESLRGVWRSLGILPRPQPHRCPCRYLSLSPAHPPNPGPSWEWSLSKARHSAVVITKHR